MRIKMAVQVVLGLFDITDRFVSARIEGIDQFLLCGPAIGRFEHFRSLRFNAAIRDCGANESVFPFGGFFLFGRGGSLHELLCHQVEDRLFADGDMLGDFRNGPAIRSGFVPPLGVTQTLNGVEKTLASLFKIFYSLGALLIGKRVFLISGFILCGGEDRQTDCETSWKNELAKNAKNRVVHYHISLIGSSPAKFTEYEIAILLRLMALKTCDPALCG